MKIMDVKISRKHTYKMYVTKCSFCKQYFYAMVHKDSVRPFRYYCTMQCKDYHKKSSIKNLRKYISYIFVNVK